MIIFYSTSYALTCASLLLSIETVVSRNDIKSYWTIDALKIGLRQPRNDVNVAVLLVNGKEDLLNLLSIRDLLWDMKIILILPDSDPDTLVKGHMLRPRFMIDCTDNFREVAAVLNRMIANVVVKNF